MGLSRTGKLNKRLAFKKNEGFKTGPNGIKIPNEVEKLKCWFAYKQRYISEVKAESPTYKDTIDIIIRQNQKLPIDPSWFVEIDSKKYEIVDINPDLTEKDFMVLVIKAVV